MFDTATVAPLPGVGQPWGRADGDAVVAVVAAAGAAVRALADLPGAALDSAGVDGLLGAYRAAEELATVLSVARGRLLGALPVVEASRAGVLTDQQTTPHEIAMTIGCSTFTVRARLAQQTVLAEMPGVLGAARAGWLRWWQVCRVAEAVEGLSPVARAEVDARIAADAAAGRCCSRFGGRLQRAVLAADPAGAERQDADAVASRTVWLRPDVSGAAVFGARLPAEDALLVGRCVDRLSHTSLSDPAATGVGGPFSTGLLSPGPPPFDPAPRGLDQRCSPDQRRADALVGLARTVLDALETGADPVAAVRAAAEEAAATGAAIEATDVPPTSPPQSRSRSRSRSAWRRGEIHLVVSAETVLGLSTAPGELLGYGPISSTHARRIAHLADVTWKRILTDPVGGSVLDVGRTRYVPPAALADHVLARHGWTCTRPGCSHAAVDLDHANAWDAGGSTGPRNLHPICRGCHTAKHRGWRVEIDRDGAVRWISPHRLTGESPPADLRPEDYLPSDRAPADRGTAHRGTADRWPEDLDWLARVRLGVGVGAPDGNGSPSAMAGATSRRASPQSGGPESGGPQSGGPQSRMRHPGLPQPDLPPPF